MQLRSSGSRDIAQVAAFLLLSAAPALAHVDLLAPNGGEMLQVGSPATIRWENAIAHNTQNWDLWYSLQGANGPWIPIALDLPPGNLAAGAIHEFTWIVPDDVSASVRVRVRQDNANTNYEDESESNLAIVPGPGAAYCSPAVPNSSGDDARLFAWGSAHVALQDLHLTATRLPAGEFGYFLNAPVQGFAGQPGASAGNLCLGGAIGRHVAQVQSSGASGVLMIELDLANLPRPGATLAVAAGETWHFQAWFRDGASSNFTDAVAIPFS